MGVGEGGGEQLDSNPPYLNPLPPGERRYFLRNPKYKIQKIIPTSQELKQIFFKSRGFKFCVSDI
jgi:hypothetical protein